MCPSRLQAVGAAMGVDPMTFVLTGGDDYGLIATFPPDVELPAEWRVVGSVGQESAEPREVTVDGRELRTTHWPRRPSAFPRLITLASARGDDVGDLVHRQTFSGVAVAAVHGGGVGHRIEYGLFAGIDDRLEQVVEVMGADRHPRQLPPALSRTQAGADAHEDLPAAVVGHRAGACEP